MNYQEFLKYINESIVESERVDVTLGEIVYKKIPVTFGEDDEKGTLFFEETPSGYISIMLDDPHQDEPVKIGVGSPHPDTTLRYAIDKKYDIKIDEKYLTRPSSKVLKITINTDFYDRRAIEKIDINSTEKKKWLFFSKKKHATIMDMDIYGSDMRGGYVDLLLKDYEEDVDYFRVYDTYKNATKKAIEWAEGWSKPDTNQTLYLFP